MQNNIYESEIDNVDMHNGTCESKIDNVVVQNDIYESQIDNVDDVDNVDMHNETCESKIDNVDALDKINNKIDTINKIKVKIAMKVKLIYGSMCELQDEIYSDDSWLRLVELNKIDAIIDEALNVVGNEICGKNRISPEKINIDKHKDIYGYVNKSTDVINNKIELVNRMDEAIDHVMSEIKNKTNMIDEKIHEVGEMDNDTLHLVDDKLNKIITQSRKELSKIVVYQI